MGTNLNDQSYTVTANFCANGRSTSFIVQNIFMAEEQQASLHITVNVRKYVIYVVERKRMRQMIRSSNPNEPGRATPKHGLTAMARGSMQH